MEKRSCLSCCAALQGRQDKKFCDDACRTLYHNQQQAEQTNLMRSIHRALRKNRAILLAQLPSGKWRTQVSKDSLCQEGFNFRYMTHTRDTSQGQHFLYCYELGYLALEGERYLIVKEKLEGA